MLTILFLYDLPTCDYADTTVIFCTSHDNTPLVHFVCKPGHLAREPNKGPWIEDKLLTPWVAGFLSVFNIFLFMDLGFNYMIASLCVIVCVMDTVEIAVVIGFKNNRGP